MGMLEEISSLLETNGAGAVGVDIFRDYMPPSPDDCIAIYAESGLGSEFTHSSPLPVVVKPGLQVLVRNARGDVGRSLIGSIYRILVSVVNRTISGTFYYRIEPLSEPFLLERDQNELFKYSCNFSVQKELS